MNALQSETRPTLADSEVQWLEWGQAAGCDRDQLYRFRSAGYLAQPKQLDFHAAARRCDLKGGPTAVYQGGSRAGAKTHAVFAQTTLDDCQRVPGLKVLFLRNIKKSAGESFDDLVLKVLRFVPHQKTSNQVLFPNGSRILIGGFKDESDIDNYLGVEYDLIVIEEITLLTDRKQEMILGSLRTSRLDWRPRLYATFNPGGVGYGYIKRNVVDPWRRGVPESWAVFVYVNWWDNAFVNDEYIAYLDRLEGPLRRSWRDGDLDAFEGAAFPQWDPTRHVIDPVPIPANWPRWRAVDYGYNPDPFCTLWFTRSLTTGRIIVYREVYGTFITDTEQARMIRDMTPPTEANMIAATYAGHDMFATKVVQGRASTNAAAYQDGGGIQIIRADTDRLGGKRKIDRVLAELPDGRPGLVVFNTCENLVRTMPLLVLHTSRTGDIADRQEDHAYDALRYGLTNYADLGAPDDGPDRDTLKYVSAMKKLSEVL